MRYNQLDFGHSKAKQNRLEYLQGLRISPCLQILKFTVFNIFSNFVNVINLFGKKKQSDMTC